MTLHELPPIVAASLGWSLLDMVRKKLTAENGAMPLLLLLVAGQLPLALGGMHSWYWPGSDYWLPAGLSIALNVIANLLFLRAVAISPLSAVIPILSFTPVFTAIGAFVFLGEKLAPREAIGVALVVAGACLLNTRGFRESEGEARRRLRGVFYMTVVALLWAGTGVFDKMCLQYAPASLHAFLLLAGIAVLLFVGLRATRRGRLIHFGPITKRWFAAAVVISAVALLSQLYAIRQSPVSLVEALKRTFGLYGALAWGVIFFRERLTAVKVGSLTLMSTGIFLIFQ